MRTLDRRLALALLAVVVACDEASPSGAVDQRSDATAPDESKAPEPEGLGLEDGQLWRLDLDGEGALAGRSFHGAVVRAKRKEFDLSIALEGEGTSLALTLVEVPMGQTGRFTATPASFRASGDGIDCGTAMGGTIKVNLTHNEKGRLAGRIEGDAGCREPSGSKAVWAGGFDYVGVIEFK